MSIEMWQSTILKSIGHSLATDGLLTHTGDHLRDVDVGTLRSTQGHDQGTICWMQLGKTGLGCLLTNRGQFTQHHRLKGLVRRTTRLTLERARLQLFDILVALGIATLQQDLLVLQQFGTGRHIANAEREATILYEIRCDLKELRK